MTAAVPGPRFPGDERWMVLRGVRQHNLHIDELALPRRGITVMTGVSGSGKSSLAFDTIYAEGYRQYLDSLSAYVRRSMPRLPQPDVDWISGLSPTVAIEQRTISRNPRSSVGSITEISDRLRLLFSRAGNHTCRKCQEDVYPRDVADHLNWISRAAARRRLTIRDGDSVVATVSTRPDREQLAALRATVHRALRTGTHLTVADKSGIVRHIAAGWICVTCGLQARATSSDWFTPNTPAGMCSTCEGLGYTLRVDPELLVADENESVRSGALSFFGDRRRSTKTWWPLRGLPDVLELSGASLDTPWRDVKPAVRELILFGTTELPLPPALLRRRPPVVMEGLIPQLERLHRDADSPGRKAVYRQFMSTSTCPACAGTRHHAEALGVRLNKLNIAEVNALPVAQLGEWLDGVAAELDTTFLAEVGTELVGQVRARVEFMLDVGLHYLSLDRPAPSLSTGEGQRLRLARQLGCGLVGVTYVLDEPSIGLHARDVHRLIRTIRRLASAGNAVIVVEHDRDTIEAADYLVDLGPGAGTRGGAVIAAGPTADVIANPASLTGRYLRRDEVVRSPRAERRTPDDRWLRLLGARLHNLQHVDVDIPVGVLTCVTGVSGSGKSSLITRTLEPAMTDALRHGRSPRGPFTELIGWDHFDRCVTVTQDSIGASSRSTPATYVGVFDELRQRLAATPESVRRGYTAAEFSFNSATDGRCDRCDGKGVVKVEMLFLADVNATCPSCDGLRYGPDVLEIRYRDLNIAETLDLEVAAAKELYADLPAVTRPLQVLCDVGLGYLKLGQETTTLSGGESQRLKLSRELMRRGDGRTLFLIDEPTTGLHFADVQVLLKVVHDLIDRGNSAIVIEHDVEFIAASDWIVDLGPGGGQDGGRLVAAGPPPDVAASPDSVLAPFLAQHLTHATPVAVGGTS